MWDVVDVVVPKFRIRHRLLWLAWQGGLEGLQGAIGHACQRLAGPLPFVKPPSPRPPQNASSQLATVMSDFKPFRLFASPLQSYAFPYPPSLTRTFHPKLPLLPFAIPAAAWSMRCNTIDRLAFQPYHSERVRGRLGELCRTRRPSELPMKHRYGDGSSHPGSQKVHQCNTIHLDGTAHGLTCGCFGD